MSIVDILSVVASIISVIAAIKARGYFLKIHQSIQNSTTITMTGNTSIGNGGDGFHIKK